MNVGDLVRNVFTGEVGIIIGFAIDNPNEYVKVICMHQEWLIPTEHLELINKASTCKPDTIMI